MARTPSPAGDARQRVRPRRLRRVPERELPASLGETLRQARRARGVTLDDAARATRIPHKYLLALEDDEPQALPGGVYGRGVLRAYARYLEIDPEPLLEYLRPARPRDERESIRPVGLLAAGRPRLPWGGLLRACGALAALALLVYLYGQYVAFSDSLRAPERPAARDTLGLPEPLVAPWTPLPRTIPTPALFAAGAPTEPVETGEPAEAPAGATPNSPTAPAPAASPTVLAAAGRAAPPTATLPPAAVTVEAQVVERSWLQVWSDGRQVFADTLLAGQTRTFTANDRLQMRVSNAGGVQVVVNGEPQGRLGAAGQAIEVTWGRR